MSEYRIYHINKLGLTFQPPHAAQCIDDDAAIAEGYGSRNLERRPLGAQGFPFAIGAAYQRGPPAVNYHQRRFLQPRRHGGWVKMIDLPDAAKTEIKLLELGWIERSGSRSAVAYRITPAGLEAMKCHSACNI